MRRSMELYERHELNLLLLTKYNAATQKPAVFIFQNPTSKDGPCSAKVIYETKEAANVAIAEFNRTSFMYHLQLSNL